MVSMTELELQTGPHRQRRRKHTFRKLPGGTTSLGSTTNPETIGRNRRRQNLPPFRAELERIRCNKANRVSSRIRKLKNDPVWQLLSEADQEAAVQVIRDDQEIYYWKDIKKVQEQYGTVVGHTHPRDRPSHQLPQRLAASPNSITQAATPTLLCSNRTTSHKGGCCRREATAEAQRRGGGEDLEEIDSGGPRESKYSTDHPNAVRENSVSPVEGGSQPPNTIQELIEALLQSQ